eukprot:1041322-Amphidinium_carterae.1
MLKAFVRAPLCKSQPTALHSYTGGCAHIPVMRRSRGLWTEGSRRALQPEIDQPPQSMNPATKGKGRRPPQGDRCKIEQSRTMLHLCGVCQGPRF